MKSGPIISRPATIINSIVRTISLSLSLSSPILHAPSSSFPPPRERRSARSFVSRSLSSNDEPLRAPFSFFLFLSRKDKRYKLRLTRSSLNFITRPFPVQCVVVHFNVGDRHRLLLNRWQEVYYRVYVPPSFFLLFFFPGRASNWQGLIRFFSP